MDPVRSGHVPGAQGFRHRGDDGAGQTRHAPRPEVVVVTVPHVPHGRVAVAEVPRPRRHPHAFGHAVRAGDHEVEAGEVEGGGGGREEGQVAAVVRLDSGQVLDEGRADVARLELRGHGAAHVQEREDGRVGKQAGQREQHLLATAHARQPVVDERGGRRCQRAFSAAACAGTLTPRTFMYPWWIARTDLSQLNCATRACPRSTRAARRSASLSTRSSPLAMSSTL